VREPRLLKQFGQRSREIIAPFTPERAAEVLAACVNRVLNRPGANGVLARQP